MKAKIILQNQPRWKIHKKCFSVLEKAYNKDIPVWKGKNNTINKQRVWISSNHYYSTCYICKNVFGIKIVRITIIIKLQTNFIIKEKDEGAAHNICNLKFGVSKEISVVFQNNMNYHYHFIIKELSKEFERDLNCLEEHNENYITFSVRITVKTYS